MSVEDGLPDVLILDDLMVAIVEDPHGPFVFFGLESYVHDSSADRSCDLFFHTRKNLNIERFESREYLCIPVLEEKKSEWDRLRFVLQLTVLTGSKYILVRGADPVIYVFGPGRTGIGEVSPQIIGQDEWASWCKQSPTREPDIQAVKAEIDAIQ